MKTPRAADPAQDLQCPVPLNDQSTILLGHGGGGQLTQDLLEQIFLPAFSNPALESRHDGALLDISGSRLAFTTDSFVVHPLLFPGGDIGSLAVNGTVNDIAMCGARPIALSAGFILEEGLDMSLLRKITASMKEAAERAGVCIVTGDTKVVDRGKGDGVFINTAGIGVVLPDADVTPTRAAAGDRVLLSGDVAIHGVAVMSAREGLEFETELLSDSAPLNDLVGAVIEAGGKQVHVLRDPTRGGVASALNEIASCSGLGMQIDEAAIPVLEEVRGACEILGLDPLYLANEGKCLAVVAREIAQEVLQAMKDHPLGRQARIIGTVVPDSPGRVVVRSRVGGARILEMLRGDPMPRIC
jgi:hydrogenase expression/formation protein HypE